MRLKKIRIQGFQSFSDSGEIEFGEGFNLVIGQNNSGKSAMLRALLPDLPNDKHRTPARWEAFQLPEPKISLTIETSGLQLRNWLLRVGGTRFVPILPSDINQVDKALETLLEAPSLAVDLYRTPNSFFVSDYPTLRDRPHLPGERVLSGAISADNGALNVVGHADRPDSLALVFWDAWNKDMFYFAAERMTIGEAPHGHAARLSPNASNLPNVLHTLQNEKGSVFNKLVEHLAEMFPTLGSIRIRTRPDNNNLEIRVWPTADMQTVELSFPLNCSGTGVAQAIAILAAIMTADNAVIVIDEINSFLHPAAVKALLRILQTEYSHHQYIISTHAPEVISFSNARTIHLVKREGYESKVERLVLGEVNQFRDVAQHLGVSMADVFAADRVIWVEGQTEELCFPYLYQIFSGRPVPRGTTITSVVATGDFNRKRDRELVYEVYNRLCGAAATLVIATMFSFDTEDLSEADKEEMVRESGGRLSFLPRRHLECYLLDPTAIANLIVAKDPTLASAVTSDAVAAKIIEIASDQKFECSEWAGTIDDQDWLAKIDAARLIGQVVSDISEHRTSFQKKEDSLRLLQDIVARDKEVVRPLYEYVERLVTKVAVS